MTLCALTVLGPREGHIKTVYLSPAAIPQLSKCIWIHQNGLKLSHTLEMGIKHKVNLYLRGLQKPVGVLLLIQQSKEGSLHH